MMNHYILTLFQLCDSNLPTGAFSHSFGLETYIQEGRVYNKETFSQWLEVYLNEQLLYNDGLACRSVYEALEKEDLESIWNWDRKLIVQILPRETREGIYKMGDRMVKLGKSLFDSQVLDYYNERIATKQSYGHSAIAFAILAHHLGVPVTTTITSFMYASISSLVQNAVRGIPLGQTQGQQLLRDFNSPILLAVESIMKLDEDDFGIVSPGLELSQMRHERVNIRIFMS